MPSGPVAWTRALLASLLVVPVVSAAEEPAPYTFAVDVAEESGLLFDHAPHRVGLAWYPEMTPGGSCLGDVDGDGYLDVYVTDSLGPEGEGRSRLFRNLGAGPLRFEDATDRWNAGFAGMGQGCTFADFDNDGWQDLFVTFAVTSYSAQGPVLLRNLEGRGFADVTAQAGVSGDAADSAGEEACEATHEEDDGSLRNLCFSVGSAWLDFDLDGDLDLYVANYVELAGTCREREAPSPQFCRGQRNRLWRNEGDGTFTEVGGAAGVAVNSQATRGHSLAVIASDVDGDGWTDLYVANDYDANALYLNERDGTFRDAAKALSVDNAGNKFVDDGPHRAGMGVDAQDLNGDGRADLLSTHLRSQYDAVYLAPAAQGATFTELARASDALTEIAHGESRWGGGFVDVDLDGRRDYLVVAGHQQNRALGPIHLALAGDSGLSLQGAPLWSFGNDTVGSWRNYRGAAFGDLDNDGDLDVVATPVDSSGLPADHSEPFRRARVLRFDVLGDNAEAQHPDNPAAGRRSLRVDLVGTDSARDAVGSRVTVRPEGGAPQTAWRSSGGSYANGNDPRLLFGLGNASRGTVEVVWPGGATSPAVPFDLGAAPSAALRVVEPDARAPAPVAWRGVAEAVEGGVRVRWTGSFATDFAAYRVRVGEGSTVVSTVEFDDRAVHEAVVPPPPGGSGWFRVAVVDAGGHESAAGEPLAWGRAAIPPTAPVAAAIAAAAVAFAIRRR